MNRRRLLGILALAALPAPSGLRAQSESEARLQVTAADQFGFPLTKLKAEDFEITQEGRPREVRALRYEQHSVLDVVLMLDTSEVGKQLRREVEEVASLFIEKVGGKEQMAVVGYGSSADLVQDFTSSKDLLRRAVGGLRYGNRPALLDSLYAAVDSAFEHAAGRRVLVVVGSGLDARSKVERREVLHLARRNRVAIFAIEMSRGGGDLEKLSDQSAGLYFHGRELKQIRQVVENLVAGYRGSYDLLLAGAGLDPARLKVDVRGVEKARVSFRVP